MRSGHLLDLAGIGVTYARDGAASVPVLSAVSLSVARGEFVVVAGRSGSGKTTLLNVAAGLLVPGEGEVRWDGTCLTALNASSLAELRGRHVGIVFQGAALIESLTAAENVAVALVPRGVTEPGRIRALRLLERVGLAGRATHFPRELSGGELQRVALARALFNDPALLLVDEPTANLDRSSADEVIEVLAGLADAGKALLVASHDPHLIERAVRCLRLEPEESHAAATS